MLIDVTTEETHPRRLLRRAGARLAGTGTHRLRTSAWVVPPSCCAPRGRHRHPAIIDVGLRDFQPTGDEEHDIHELTRLILHSMEGVIRTHPSSGSSSAACGTRRRLSRPRGPREPGGRRVLSWLPRPSKWRYYVMLIVVNTIGRMPLSWRYASPASSRTASTTGAAHRPERPQQHPPRTRTRCVGRGSRPYQPPVCAQHARYYADVVGMHRLNVKEFMDRDLTLDGLEYIHEARKAGHGVVVASAHYGTPSLRCRASARPGSRCSPSSSHLIRPNWGG